MEIHQKSIEHFCHDMKVPEDKREPVLMAMTKSIYERNQYVIRLEKEIDPEAKAKLEREILERDESIKKKIESIVNGETEEIHYEF
ncbi:MAG: hypothetical protein Q8Q20_04160 [bacterium]|nr:hypothetical protein [bacterium]